MACNRSTQTSPTPTPTSPPLVLTSEQLEGAVLTEADAGAKWDGADQPTPSTVLIGGEVGPGNIEAATAQATSAFKQKSGSSYLSDTLLLAPTEDLARAVMLKHEEVGGRTKWTQERNDGGTSAFRRTDPIADLPDLGDEMYTAKLEVKITDADGNKTGRAVEYVAFRVRNLVAFVVTQDAHASVYARRLEPKVLGLVG